MSTKNIRFNLISLAVLAFVMALLVFEFTQENFIKSNLVKKTIIASCGYNGLNSTYVASHPRFSTLSYGSRKGDMNHQSGQRKPGDKNNCSHQSAAQTSIWIGGDKKTKANLC